MATVPSCRVVVPMLLWTASLWSASLFLGAVAQSAKAPGERFQTAKEVAELLGQHLAHLQQPSLVPPPNPVVMSAAPNRAQGATPVQGWSAIGKQSRPRHDEVSTGKS